MHKEPSHPGGCNYCYESKDPLKWTFHVPHLSSRYKELDPTYHSCPISWDHPKSPFSTKEGYAMREDTVVQLRQPGAFSEDALTEILRLGARRLLAQAVEREVTTFVEMHAKLAIC